MILRQYQDNGVDDIHDAFAAGHQSVCYVLPTGGGKTVIFVEVARRASEYNTRTCILVHRDTLLLQASRKLSACGIPHGIIAPGRRATWDLVQVASVQTLARHLDRHNFDFLIPDEAHHAVSPTYQKIFAAYPMAHVLGVTATPIRTDGRGLDEVFETLVKGPSIRQLIDDGYLVEPVLYGPAKRVNLANIQTRMGDYDQRQLADAMDTHAITGNAIQHYLKLCKGQPALAFCVSIQHAKDVAAEACAAGVRAAAVSGKDDLEYIRRTIAGLSDGTHEMVASCDLISEGFDAPAVVAIVSLRPTKSLAVYIQQGGRGLRPDYAPGMPLTTRQDRLAAIAASVKPRAMILDHAGNCFRFGTLDEERDWSLEGRKKNLRGAAVEDVAVKQCPKCFACHKPATICPLCGHVYETVDRELDLREGELEQIDVAALQRARADEIRLARTYDELKKIGKRRGYSSQWAWRIFNERLS